MKKASTNQVYHVPVVIEKDKEGYFAVAPTLQGCYSQGSTYEEALMNITNAVRLHLEDRLAEHEEISQPRSVSLSTIEVALGSV